VRRAGVSALAVGALAWSVSYAQEEALVLDQITVAATEGPVAGMAGETTLERDELLGEFQGASLPTILNTVPGVTTETTPGDPAIAVNIRGLQGKGRVVVTIDGARQNFAKSDHGPTGTFYADPEMLRSVEVIRGPAGAGAAAGAIGGTLALRTVEAADLIAPGAAGGGEFRLRYGTLTEAPTVHLAYARELWETSDVLLAFTREQASDYDAGDGTEVWARETGLSGLAKYSVRPTDSQEVTLSWSGIQSTFRTGT
jgi:hemoglobin/transferrin/lactoferrin receptor protein